MNMDMMMSERERNQAFRRRRQMILRERTQMLVENRREIVNLLRAARRSIRTILAAQPTDFQQWHLGNLEREVRDILGMLERDAGQQLRAGARTAWEAGQRFVTEPLEAGGLRLEAVLPRVDPRQLNAISSFMVSRMKDITEQAANKITQQLGLVVIGGQSPSDAIASIGQVLNDRSRATTVVRTEVGRVFSVAAQRRAEQAAEIVPGLKKQWRRSGKINSRLHHDAIDGQVREVNEPFRLGNGVELMFPRDPKAPPAETINCGCESLPFMESWDVAEPGRRPFSEREQRLSPTKRELERAGFSRRRAA